MQFSIFLISLILAATLLGSGFSARQYITVYEDQNQQGANLTLDKKYANLSEHVEFLHEASSFCAVGWIAFFTNYDFNLEGGVAFLIDNNDSAPKCQNRVFSNYHSMRYMGNQNTDLPGLSMYSKPNYHGAEVFIDENGNLSEDITIPVNSLVSTGWGNYTFYQGANYSGSSWCVKSTAKIHMVAEIDVSFSNVKSVAVGCNSTKIINL